MSFQFHSHRIMNYLGREKMKTSKYLGVITILLLMLTVMQVGNAAAEDMFTLTVNFPGISTVHTYVKQSDGVSGTATGLQVASQTYQNNQAVFASLPNGIYDLAVVKGAKTLVVDDVSINGDTVVDDLVATLMVKFPGISTVHTYVRVDDGVAGTATGGDVENRTYQNDETSMVVLKNTYDVVIKKGAKTKIIDAVDCTGETCLVDDIVATLTVKFPGISTVHTYVKVDDGVADSATGGDVENRTYQNDETSMAVLKNTYDVVVKKGAKTKIIDAVDCTDDTCLVDDLVATLTVKFPGISTVHTYVRVDDGVAGTATGGDVENRTYQNDETSMVVLKSTYDVVVKKGAKTKIIDAVDCTGNTCLVDNIVATLTVNFPGLSNVHTYIKTIDGVLNSATGGDVDNRTYQNYSTTLALLKNHYDVVVKVGTETYIFDDVDCTGNTCTINLGNEPPIANPNGPYLDAVGIPIMFDGTASSDPDNDPLNFAWDFGDSNTGTGEMPSHSYAIAGIYDVCLTVNDGYVDSEEECTIAVVYDPNGGFVTGGGWFVSPTGAYKADETLTGKATFGFVAKYKKGANVPDGNTEFQFKAGDLNFHSTSYEWLVVAGNKAQFKGEGTINGAGSYKFIIFADDDSPDTFRIQIWGDIGTVYDNGSQQGLGGGSIVVHK
jgi:tRNA uridine 5-carbamoylmethylation protein Kti12